MRVHEFVISRTNPEIALPKIPAIIPKVEATPTRVPVEFGPISAWLTPNPPAAAPVKRFVIQIKIIIIEIDSKSGIKKMQNAETKKPI